MVAKQTERTGDGGEFTMEEADEFCRNDPDINIAASAMIEAKRLAKTGKFDREALERLKGQIQAATPLDNDEHRTFRYRYEFELDELYQST